MLTSRVRRKSGDAPSRRRPGRCWLLADPGGKSASAGVLGTRAGAGPYVSLSDQSFPVVCGVARRPDTLRVPSDLSNPAPQPCFGSGGNGRSRWDLRTECSLGHALLLGPQLGSLSMGISTEIQVSWVISSRLAFLPPRNLKIPIHPAGAQRPLTFTFFPTVESAPDS